MAVKRIRNTDKAWEILEDKYHILDAIDRDGTFEISAQQIKQAQDLVPKTQVNLEPRLITKYDTTASMPHLFQENNLSLLPTAHGQYLIGKFRTFHVLENVPGPIQHFRMPHRIESLGLDGYDNLSEDTAMAVAYASGMVEDFMGDSGRVYPSVYGRSRSKQFEFSIRLADGGITTLSVDRCQIEIDWSGESAQSLMLVEAKAHFPNEFMVRQLYYPYRKFADRMRKPVRPTFMAYSQGVYTFWEYQFVRPREYSSLRVVNARRYSIHPARLTMSDLMEVWGKTPVDEEGPFAFPQADSVERTLDLILFLGEPNADGRLGKSTAEIGEHYKFTSRQGGYYNLVLRYLGLSCEASTPHRYRLTDLGEQYLDADPHERTLIVYRQLVGKPTFRKLIQMSLEKGAPPPREAISDVLRELSTIGESSEVLRRRASTARAWCQWVLDNATDSQRRRVDRARLRW